MRTEERFLAGAADIGLEEVVAEVHSMGGMVIPAHVDRPSFSLLSNLGLVPDSLEVQALEVTPQFVPTIGFQKWPQLKAWCLIVNGDAHRLQEMQNRTLFKIAAPVVQEIRSGPERGTRPAGRGGMAREHINFSARRNDCMNGQETFDLAPLDKMIDEFGGKAGTLIPILQRAQEIYGYLPPDVLKRVSEKTGIPLSQIYGVVTFYAQFYLTRRGKCIVKQCDGTACHVRGAGKDRGRDREGVGD